MKRLVLIFALLLASPAWGAAYRTSVAGGGSTGTSNRTVTITPAVNDLFVVFVVVAGNTNDTPTMSDNNGSGTYNRILVEPFQSATPVDYRLSVFVRTALMANTTSTVITAATGSNTAGELVVVAVSGMTLAGSAAVHQSAGYNNGAAGENPLVEFGSSINSSSSMMLGAVGDASNPAAISPPTGYSERHDTGQNSPPTGLEVVTKDTGVGVGTTMTWTSATPSEYAAIGIELSSVTSTCTQSIALLGVGCR